jgi:D-xylose transport system permease protein
MSSTPTPPQTTIGGDDQAEPPRGTAAEDVALLANPDLVATSLGEYIHAWVRKVRQGDSGMLPIVGGLILIAVIFQSQNTKFLSAGNLANLLGQGAPYVLLGMAEVFVLLLGEIDLSIGYLAGVGAVITVAVNSTHNQPWWWAVILGLAACTAIGALQGFIITRLKLPSFVVTLAGYLGLEGVLLWLTNREAGPSSGGTIQIKSTILRDLVAGNLNPAAGWIVMIIAVALFGAFTILRDRRRASAGLVAPPLAVSALKVVVIAAAGIAIVIICNINRGLGRIPVKGVPWSLPIVLGVLFIWTFLLGRTRFGRYMYAVGGNAEAARRAGINLNRIRMTAFALTGMTAGAAGIIYASFLGSISNDINGGQLVLYAVAAAVIGGTSLFGGRGKMLHAVLGGVVVATIYNGMSIIGLSSAADQDMVIALVLLAAVTVDAVARRGSASA